MADDGLAPLQSACETLRKAGDGTLRWEWDERVCAATASFPSELERSVLGTLDEIFDRIWSATEVRSGSAEIVELAASLGDLRSGQMLLTAQMGAASPLLFCAWWPWSSGQRISIRIGMTRCPANVSEAEVESSLRTWFGI